MSSNETTRTECYLCGNKEAIRYACTGGAENIDCPECHHYMLSDLALQMCNVYLVRTEPHFLDSLRARIREAEEIGDIYVVKSFDLNFLRPRVNQA